MMAEILHRVVQDSTFVNRRVDIVDMQLVPPISCKWPRPMRWSFWPWVSSSRPSSCHYSLRGSNRKIKTLLEQMNLVGRSGGLMGVWTGSSNIGRSFIYLKANDCRGHGATKQIDCFWGKEGKPSYCGSLIAHIQQELPLQMVDLSNVIFMSFRKDQRLPPLSCSWYPTLAWRPISTILVSQERGVRVKK